MLPVKIPFPRTKTVKDYGAKQAVNICRRDLTAYKKEVDWTFADVSQANNKGSLEDGGTLRRKMFGQNKKRAKKLNVTIIYKLNHILCETTK